MRDEEIALEVTKIYILAYRPGMTVKEFRQSIMDIARYSENLPLKDAMMQTVPNLSNAKLAGVMESAARVKAEYTRRMLMALPADESDTP